MSSYKNHRVLIASLFLPDTAVLDADGSAPASPDPAGARRAPPPGLNLSLDGAVGAVASALNPGVLRGLVEDLVARTPAAASTPRPDPFATPLASPAGAATPGITRPMMPGPLKSIVQDLEEKSRHPSPLATPVPPASSAGGGEGANPFFARPGAGALPHHAPSRVVRTGSGAAALARGSSTSRRAAAGATRQRWHVEPNPSGNGGLHNAVRSVRDRVRRRLWVGTLGTATDAFGAEARKDVDARMRAESDSLPVWIPDNEFSKCYDEFCHQVLWPCLHYAIPDAPKVKVFYESGAWKEYQAVNQRFADAIVSVYEEGDIIWVNDYHLLLLPGLLRARLPSAIIGFFLHVAFPSSEIFRCLAVREPVLRGLLAADLVGFQTANHARHFRQTVSRILALEATPKGIQASDDRFVDVGVFPMGIDVEQLTARRAEPEVAEWIRTLRERYAGLKLVVGRDKLDEIQGVRHKLLAFEEFLEHNADARGKVVLIQVALLTSGANEVQGGVAAVVSRINSRFSSLTYQPVVFLHTGDVTFAQYIALLTVADAFLVTSMREGMALRTHEFVACQEERKRPLILSEFTGSYTYRGFRSCIAINPWDRRGTAAAIQKALTMPDDEAAARWEDLHTHVVAQSAQAFVTSFLQRCLRTNIEHLRGDAAQIAALQPATLLPRYRHSDRRLLLLELEATLWTARDIRGGRFEPPEEAMDVVRRLADDMRNEVWVLSGLRVKGMLEHLAAALPGVGIVAENGCFIKPRGAQEWLSMVDDLNLSWKEPCLEILQYFTERTPGAFVEERDASVVWRYWTGPSSTTDRAWARRQAAEAQNHIFDSIGERFGLRIIPGANSFLVLPNNISRSAAVSLVLHPTGPVHSPRSPGAALRGARRALARRGSWMPPPDADLGDNAGGEGAFDFVLALGSDERLLRRLNELDGAETVSTSGRGSDAKWRLDAADAVGVLRQFAAASSSSAAAAA